MAEVRIENISKMFAGKTILDKVSLNVPDRSFTSILGPPGAGKTTLLRVIVGVESPNEGRIYIDGEDITDLPAKDRNVGMVYQTFALYPHMTVYDNISNPLKAKKMSKDEMDERVRGVTEFLKISHLLSRYPRELSGGEKQRVALGRCLVREAKLYLLDEPLTNLDYKLREDARIELRRMSSELGCTIIYATPDPIDALTMSEYIYVLLDGKVEQHGPTREVYDLPENMRVARCFSAPPTNLVNCLFKKGDERLSIETSFVKIDISSWERKVSLAEDEYVLGIKPHQISISSEAERGKISFKAKLHLTYIVGSETIGYLDANGVDLTVHLPYIYRIQKPQQVWASFSPENILLFNTVGERVYPEGP